MIQEIPLHQEFFSKTEKAPIKNRKNRKCENVVKLKTLMKMKFSKGNLIQFNMYPSNTT